MANRAKLKKDAARRKRLRKILVAKQNIEDCLTHGIEFDLLYYLIRLARKAP